MCLNLRGMSKSRVLYPFALNESGVMIVAKDATNGGSYYCPGCDQPMVARRGQKNQPHFAHKVEITTCSPETTLHLLAKETIKRGIEDALREGRAYEFKWYCLVCHDWNVGNLATTRRRILLEEGLDGIRPDLLAVSKSNKPLVAIEVVVTHAPEEQTLDIYSKLKLPVVIIEVKDWHHLIGMEHSLLQVPVSVLNGSCRSSKHPPQCNQCRRSMSPIVLEVWQGYTCYKCHKPLPILFFSRELWCDERALQEVATRARRLGVNLCHYKTKGGEQEVAHRCPYCRAWQRNLYVYTGRYNDWKPNPDEPIKIANYFWCERCNTWK